MRTLPFFLACAMLFTTTGRAQEEEETAAEEHSVETAAPENPEPKARPGTAGGAEAATAKPVEGRGLSAGGGDHAPRGKALAGQSQDAGAKACGAKPAGLVLLPNLGNEGASQVRAFGVDRPYAMELKNSAGKRLLRGYLVHAEHPSTSDPIDIEWAISRCPGDFDWAKSPAGASVGSARGGRQTTSYPCRTVGSRTGGRIGWWTGVRGPNSWDACPITDGDWYLNMRFIWHPHPEKNAETFVMNYNGCVDEADCKQQGYSETK